MKKKSVRPARAVLQPSWQGLVAREDQTLLPRWVSFVFGLNVNACGYLFIHLCVLSSLQFFLIILIEKILCSLASQILMKDSELVELKVYFYV